MATANITGRAANAYIQNPRTLKEDNRTRYLYSPGEQINVIEKEWAIDTIIRGVIMRVGKRDYYDSSLTAGEMAQAAMAYKNFTQSRGGPNPYDADNVPANVQVRSKSPIDQIHDIVGQYGIENTMDCGVTEIKSPLNYTESMLPAGWTIEQAVDVLDIVLHPKDGQRRKIVENLTFLKEQSHFELETFLVPMRNGGSAKLPPIIQQLGLEIRSELISATERTINCFLRDWSDMEAEMKNRDLGGMRGKNKLDKRDMRIQEDLGLPTPITRKVEYEGQAEAKTAGMLENIFSKFAEKWPGMSGKQDAPQIDEEAMALRVMEMIAARESDIGQKAIAEAISKGLLVAPEPKAEAPKKENKK